MKNCLFRVRFPHTVRLIRNGHTGNPWRYGGMNITFFALSMRTAIGGTTDRQKPAVLSGGNKNNQRAETSSFF